jgi:hypothetical protein
MKRKGKRIHDPKPIRRRSRGIHRARDEQIKERRAGKIMDGIKDAKSVIDDVMTMQGKI